MKTTIDIPDDLYPTLAAASSAAGVSLGAYLLIAGKEKAKEGAPVAAASSTPDAAGRTLGEFLADFYASFEALPVEEQGEIRRSAAEVQAIIDEEFSKIDPQDWE